MSAPALQVLQFDLAVARAAEPILGVGIKYDAVTIHQLPGGSVAELKFGNNPGIPLLRTETWRFTDSCEHPFFCDEGLFLTNAAGGGILIVVVSLGTNPAIQGN